MPDTSIADSSRSLAVRNGQEEFSVEKAIEGISRTTLWGAFTGVLMADVWTTWFLAVYAPLMLVPAILTMAIGTGGFLALLKRGPGSDAFKAIQERLEAKNDQSTDHDERYG